MSGFAVYRCGYIFSTRSKYPNLQWSTGKRGRGTEGGNMESHDFFYFGNVRDVGLFFFLFLSRAFFLHDQSIFVWVKLSIPGGLKSSIPRVGSSTRVFFHGKRNIRSPHLFVLPTITLVSLLANTRLAPPARQHRCICLREKPFGRSDRRREASPDRTSVVDLAVSSRRSERARCTGTAPCDSCRLNHRRSSS